MSWKLSMESVEQHQNCAKRNDSCENQLILALFDVDALHEGIDSWEGVGEVVETILKTFE